MFRLYVEKRLEEDKIINLSGEQAFRALSVLRLREKDRIILFNGFGGEYKSVVTSTGNKSLKLRVGSFHNINREQDVRVHLFQGISRNDRMQYSIQKSCELGVRSITPLLSEKCNFSAPKSRIKERVKHWRNIAISASEQSGRCLVTEVKEPLQLSVALRNTADNVFIGYPKSKMTLKDYNIISKKDLYVAIGPERGFSNQEYKLALDLGAHLFSMGSRILRSETASVAVLSMIQAIQFE